MNTSFCHQKRSQSRRKEEGRKDRHKMRSTHLRRKGEAMMLCVEYFSNYCAALDFSRGKTEQFINPKIRDYIRGNHKVNNIQFIIDRQQIYPCAFRTTMKKEADSTKERTGELKNHHNNHFALRKLKDAEEHIEMMKRRFQVLKVKDDECRSMTIQHEKKIKYHDEVQRGIKKDKDTLDKVNRMKMYEVETYMEKNKKLKNTIEEKLKTARDNLYKEKVQENRKSREQHKQNEEIYAKIKEDDYQIKQERRKIVNKQEEMQKLRASRYMENKVQETILVKSADTDGILNLALKKEKQLERLSKMEEEMVKRNSESVEVSVKMKNRLREVLGDERRFTKLPHLRSRTTQLTGSSNNSSQLVII